MCLFCGAPERFYTRNGTRLTYGPLDHEQVISCYGGFTESILPKPGVYMAVGPAPQGRILYVGRARSVRARVLTHKASPWFRLLLLGLDGPPEELERRIRSGTAKPESIARNERRREIRRLELQARHIHIRWFACYPNARSLVEMERNLIQRINPPGNLVGIAKENS